MPVNQTLPCRVVPASAAGTKDFSSETGDFGRRVIRQISAHLAGGRQTPPDIVMLSIKNIAQGQSAGPDPRRDVSG